MVAKESLSKPFRLGVDEHRRLTRRCANVQEMRMALRGRQAGYVQATASLRQKGAMVVERWETPDKICPVMPLLTKLSITGVDFSAKTERRPVVDGPICRGF